MTNDLPPGAAVYQQTQRWIAAGCFEDIVDDLREMIRQAAGKKPQPSAIILDGQTIPGTIESGHRSGYDGHKKTNGSKIHHPRRRGYPPLIPSVLCWLSPMLCTGTRYARVPGNTCPGVPAHHK